MRHMRHMHHAAAEICKARKTDGGLMEHKWKMVWLNQYSSEKYGA